MQNLRFIPKTLGALCALYIAPVLAIAQTATVPPISWIDQSTGHRIVRLTDVPGSKAPYFNWTAFTPDGSGLLYTANQRLFFVNPTTRVSRLLVGDAVREYVVDKKNARVYLLKPNDSHLYSVDMVSGASRQLAVLPARASIDSVNADGTLLAGSYIEGSGANYDTIAVPKGIRPTKLSRIIARAEAQVPMTLFTYNLASGAINAVLHTTDWLNHIQFSPTDPTLLLYCHEGLWEQVDRIWTVRADGSANTLIHKRTQPMEIAGHEFWDADGKTVWYDLQIPKGKTFYLASYNTTTGQRSRYQMNNSQWSLHFTGDLASGLFAGDGGGEFQVAGAKDGQWIELYKPQSSGVMQSLHLASLSAQDYQLEPNVHFTPDHKWVIFTSNMFGPSYVFAVEVSLPGGQPAPASAFTSFVPGPITPDMTATIQVLNSSGGPLANAVVQIKSLDTGQSLGVFTSEFDGTIPTQTFNQGSGGSLYRITITCPNGSCGDTRKELSLPQLTGTLKVAAHPASSSAPGSGGGSLKTTLLVQAKGKNLANTQILVRTMDASSESWYETNANGRAAVTLPADPSLAIVLVNRGPRAFQIGSSCATSLDSDLVGCVTVGATTVLAVP